MNQPLPRTPFSTQLSGSAKETEIRIRNIFSGPKKRPPFPLIVLIAALILLCGNLVAFRSLPAEPVIVMETQYYDSFGNYIEIPALALPAGEKNETVEAINAALNDLRKEYTQLSSRTGTDALENQCLFYPSTTDRYLNLLFFRSRFTTDLNTGHVFSLVYDLKEGELVFPEDALARAGLNERALLDQVAERLEPELNPEGQDYRIALHNLTLEGFRIRADGQPVFYLTGRMDDVDDAVLDAVSGADHLFIWADRAVTIYSQYSLEPAPLVPAEETDKLDPPLWNQWYFAGEEPRGGFADQLSPETSMVLDFLQAEYQCNAYLPENIPEQPQPGDRCLDSAGTIADGFLDEILYSLYEIDTRVYTQDQGWQPSSPAYAVLTMAQGVDFKPIAVYNYSEDVDPSDIMCQAIWGLSDLEVCLFRDGDSTPVGPGSGWPSRFDALYPNAEVQVLDGGYYPGDYWDSWDAGELAASRYYNAELDRFSINSLDVTRADMATPKGIRVGSTRAEVLEAYPTAIAGNYWDVYPGEDLVYYIPGLAPETSDGFWSELGPALVFLFDGDTVKQIGVQNMFN